MYSYSLKSYVVGIVSIFLLAGCSITYVDSQGFEHSIGFVHQKINVKKELLYVDKSYFGLSVGLSETDGGFNLGYKQTTRVFAPEDTRITVDRNEDDLDIEVESYR